MTSSLAIDKQGVDKQFITDYDAVLGRAAISFNSATHKRIKTQSRPPCLPPRSLSSLSDDNEEARAKYLHHQWVELGLTDVQLSNYSVLLSLPGPSPSTLLDRSSQQCFLPSGGLCDPPGRSPSPEQRSSYAAYSAVGSLEVPSPHTPPERPIQMDFSLLSLFQSPINL